MSWGAEPLEVNDVLFQVRHRNTTRQQFCLRCGVALSPAHAPAEGPPIDLPAEAKGREAQRMLTAGIGERMKVRTTDDSLAIYEGRDLSSKVVATPPKNTTIDLGASEEADGREWIEVAVDGDRKSVV